MNKIYEIPNMEVINLSVEDVIATSMTPGGAGGSTPGGTTPWTFG